MFWHRLLAPLRRWRYPGDAAYWQQRYARGGDSGSGSGGALAAHKALTVNAFVKKYGIQSVTELGCGDGRQLQLAEYPQYVGLDLAPAAVERCRVLFAGDSKKKFDTYNPANFDPNPVRSDLALSMEVIFHLTNERLYEQYLRDLFACAHTWVLIFAPDQDDYTGGVFPHFRPRRFTPDVARLAPQWLLHEQLAPPPAALSGSQWWAYRRLDD
jgi:SAM-dependent methyltransferase